MAAKKTILRKPEIKDPDLCVRGVLSEGCK